MTMLAAYPGASGAGLARLGMILRRPHEEHGIIQLIELSGTGHEVLARSKEAVRSAEAGLLTDVTPEDEAIIRRWLVQIARLPL